MEVFLSVGRTSTKGQEDFICAVEKVLRTHGLEPRTVGRTSFSADQPLKHIHDLMRRCSGTVIVAFERTHIEAGTDRRGSESSSSIHGVKLPTVWNQIEAALAYSEGHPLLVLVEHGLKSEGLLEKGYDWYVQSVDIDEKALSSGEFQGVLADWKTKLGKARSLSLVPDELTIGQLVSNMKPAQLWGTLGAIFAVFATSLAFAFQVGARAAPSTTASSSTPAPQGSIAHP